MAGRYKSSRDAALIPYHVARGDELLQDRITDPATIRRGLDMLSRYGGNLAYSPEMVARFQEVFMRRFETDEGSEIYEMPNGYAVYEDPHLAAFHGADTSDRASLRTQKETFDEAVDRLLEETVRELAPEFAGLAQNLNDFENEQWARHGVSDEAPFVHYAPDSTIFRNPTGGWCPIDVAVSTSEKSNVINMYEGATDYVFPLVHPAWEVDREGGFYSNLS